MRGRAVACRESLSWDNERCRVRTEILEKVDKAIENDETSPLLSI
jgi:hypothetical protein